MLANIYSQLSDFMRQLYLCYCYTSDIYYYPTVVASDRFNKSHNNNSLQNVIGLLLLIDVLMWAAFWFCDWLRWSWFLCLLMCDNITGFVFRYVLTV